MRRTARPHGSLAWIVTWPLTIVFAAMVFLAAEKMRQPPHEAPQPIGGPNWEERLPERIEAVTKALEASRLRLPRPVEQERGSGPLRWTHRRYNLTISRAEQSQAESAIEALRGVDAGLIITSEATFDGVEVLVGLDGLLTHTLRFRWKEQPAKPRLAVVINSLGADLRVAREVVRLDAPVALAVIPSQPFSREVAKIGLQSKREVLVQLPEVVGDGAGADQSGRLEAALGTVPDAVGVLGGLADDRPGAGLDGPMVAELKRRGLFYVGRSQTVAPQVSGRKPGIVIRARVVSLESGGQPGGVARRLVALISAAREEGVAIGVGRADDATITALREAILDWRVAKIEVVPLSELASGRNLSTY